MPDRRTEVTATPDDVLARIDPNEVVDLALALGNIDSPTGSEGPAGEFVFRWLAGNGFAPKKYAMIPRALQRCRLDRRIGWGTQPHLQRASRHDAPCRRGVVRPPSEGSAQSLTV